MARITIEEVQQYLEDTKLEIDVIDEALADSSEDEILGLLKTKFVTSGWDDETTTPIAVRSSMAALYASRLYRRSFSDGPLSGDNVATYADKLEGKAYEIAYDLIDGIRHL